jgi:hypothetical protein
LRGVRRFAGLNGVARWTGRTSTNVGRLPGFFVSSVDGVAANDVWAGSAVLNGPKRLRTLVVHWNGKRWQPLLRLREGRYANATIVAVSRGRAVAIVRRDGRRDAVYQCRSAA